MSLTYRLHGETLEFKTTGDVEHTPGLEILKAGFAEAARTGRQSWDLYFDIRASTENREAGELRQIAATIAAYRSILTGGCAVVAGDPLHYGLARMFAVFMETLGFAVRVCTAADEAHAWLHRHRESPAIVR
jgi:nitrogenase molybdenum-iron protein alpha/beta subunit